jgi:hypothetical protein
MYLRFLLQTGSSKEKVKIDVSFSLLAIETAKQSTAYISYLLNNYPRILNLSRYLCMALEVTNFAR